MGGAARRRAFLVRVHPYSCRGCGGPATMPSPRGRCSLSLPRTLRLQGKLRGIAGATPFRSGASGFPARPKYRGQKFVGPPYKSVLLVRKPRPPPRHLLTRLLLFPPPSSLIFPSPTAGRLFLLHRRWCGGFSVYNYPLIQLPALARHALPPLQHHISALSPPSTTHRPPPTELRRPLSSPP